MTLPPETLADQALEHLLQLPGSRKLIALAGPPAAGKSTVASLLCDRLMAQGRSAAVVPMDGFHLDNTLLEARGLLHRKGSAETFDADGFCHLVGRVFCANADIVYQVFDRHRDIAIAGVACVKADVEFVLFEGNYLLLKDAPWSQLAQFWTSTISIITPLDQLQARLTQRWLSEGLSELEARRRANENDLANAAFVTSRSRRADLTLSTVI